MEIGKKLPKIAVLWGWVQNDKFIAGKILLQILPLEITSDVDNNNIHCCELLTPFQGLLPIEKLLPILTFH